MLLYIDLLGLEEKDLEWYQMMTRTVVVFIAAVAFIRLAGMRTFGTKTPFDVVVSITLGALLSRCITGHYPFFATLLAAMSLAVVHRLCAWLAFRSKIIQKLMEGDSVLLFRNGVKEHRRLAKHCISEKDIIKALHEECLDSLDKVKELWLEPDGKISVIKKEDNPAI
ncbi:MAG: hypothetical protein JWO09_1542 [Bacteroidetes bacterium]|nr:hypothetical protein [Bacteroidota bacterium]